MSRFTKSTEVILWEKYIYTKDWFIREVWYIWSGEFFMWPPIFKFDGISSPRFLWWYIPKLEINTILAWTFHDWGYRIKGRYREFVLNNWLVIEPILIREGIDIKLFKSKLRDYSRAEIDFMFGQMLIAKKNSLKKSNIMYKWVHIFWSHYWNQPITQEGLDYINGVTLSLSHNNWQWQK